ncbi:MAG: glycoside hydrolase family 9 protein [Oscillospiraceae bacterium]
MFSRYLEHLKRAHRYLAVLVVLSLVVTFVVPLGLIENAESKTGQLICGMIEHTHNAECDYGSNCTITPHTHTEDCYRRVTLLAAAGNATEVMLQTNAAGEAGNIVGGVTYSPEQVGLLTLLFGQKTDGEPLDWLEDVTTLDVALRAAEDEYFLGMASDFCAFIEGDFIPTDADAEGRVAAGGNLMFQQTESNYWNYQIASGDYQSMTPIQDTGPYQGITGFASALAGGKLFRINTMSSGNKDQVTGAITAGAHTSGSTVYYTPENGGFKSFLVGNVNASRHWDGDKKVDIFYSTSCHHDYPSDCPVCAGDLTEHAYLGTVNELAQMYQYNPTEAYPDLRQIITTVFSEIRNRSQTLSQMSSIPGSISNGVANFTYTGPKDVETVYFELDAWDDGLHTVNFSNIPMKKNADGSERPVNIIVNCGGQQVNLRANSGNFVTKIGNTDIHKEGNSGQNNHEWSSCVLYNFYDATKMSLNGNFNGTILAPNADVQSDDKCSGHLSGALIAKSFYGGIEFGYRPYRGGSDILGMVSSYAIPVDKFNGNGAFLSGAQLKVEQSTDNGSTFKTFMEHITAGKTWWIPFQSMVDYSGNTKYLPELVGNDTMTVGGTQQLTVSNAVGAINLQGEVWSSSDPDIVSVDNGIVTAKKAGTATVTLTVGGVSFTKEIKVSSVTITGDATMLVGGTQTLTTNSNDTYTWQSSDTSIATVDENGNVQALTAGEVTITCQIDGTVYASFVIQIRAPLTIRDSLVSELYEGESINLADMATGGSGNSNNYAWSITAGDNAAAVNGTAFTTKDISAETMVTLCVKDTVTNETKEKQIKVKPLAIIPNNGYSMTLGATQTLQITAPAGMTYSIVSGAENVVSVTVSDGTVTATANEEGKATIQLLVDGIPYASVELTVSSTPTSNPITISSAMPSAMYEGESINLADMASGGSGSYTWTVDNTNIAVITDNVLNANADITDDAVVQLTVTDSNSQTATHNVTIHPVSITATNSTITVDGDPNTAELTITNGSHLTLTASDNGAYATLSGTTVTAKAAGTVTYSLTKNGTTYASVTITVNPKEGQGGSGLFSLQNGESKIIKIADGKTPTAFTATIIHSGYVGANIEMLGTTDNQLGGGYGGAQENDSTLNVPLSVYNPGTISSLKITANQGSFTVNSYTITYSDGSSETYPKTKSIPIAARAKGVRKAAAIRAAGDTMTQTFTQQYRITEVQPPEGYIGDGTVYIVKVSETIDLTQIEAELKDGRYYPMSTVTQMEFYSEVKEGETVSRTLLETVQLVINDVYHDNLTNTRTVQIGGCTFTMEIDAQTETVTSLSINGTEQSGISLTEPSLITVGDSQFRFDPAHMMVIPAPAAEQSAVINFTNNAGVLFKKVDDVNEPVSKATIEMSQLVGDTWTKIDDVEIFDAAAVKSDALTMMNLKDYLETAGVYIFRFEETKTPSGYETAAPVYFKIEVANDHTVTYYISSDNAVWKPLQPQGGANGYYVIPMVDNLQYGIKLSLKKVDGKNHEITLQDAKFALYAADHTLIYPLDKSSWITTGADGTVNLSALFTEHPELTNNLYVTKGFLVQGDYYLKEMVAPTSTDAGGNEVQYALPTETFAFTVDKESNGNYTLVVAEPIATHGFTTVGKDNHQALLITGDGLASVTDEMISSNQTILTITYNTPSGEINWGNGQYCGLYGAESKTSEQVKPSNTTETVNLTAADILTKLGIGYDDSSLITEFRKLQQFSFEVWNSTKIESYTFLGETNRVVPTAYDLSAIAWSIQGGIPSVTIKALTLYYLNGDTATINDVKCSSTGEWWSPLDLSDLASLEDVVGVTLETGGSGSNKIIFQTVDKVNVWESDISANAMPSFGDTSKINYTVKDTTPSDAPLQAIDNSIIQIANDELGANMDFRVEKHWVGDSQFLMLRPSKIEVELWRSTNADGSNGTRVEIDGITNPVTLTAEEGWTYLWENLPRKSDTGETYYYYVNETIASVSDRYLPAAESQPSNVGGIYVITNTLKTGEVSVGKTWESSGYRNVDLPDVLRLQLQWKIGDKWEDVPGKVLVLRKPADATAKWTGQFTELPVGYEYRVREMNLPYGWTMSKGADITAKLENTGDNKPIEFTNTFKVDESQLSVSKNWEDDESSDRPDEIILNLYQSVIAPSSQYSDMPYGDDPESVQNDYARLLQYSLYFYDANMCGDQAQQNSAVSWRGNCHIEDEVQGGYHDAGDHVMFGLPQGYAASTVGWGYYEFKDVYEELGQVKHYEIIMKQFCDFFVNATELDEAGNVKRLLYQKGDGDTDHSYWGAPENQADRSDQMYWVTEGASDVAAEYAAALALQCLNFPNDPQRDTYLQYAKALFAFSVRDNQAVRGKHLGFYGSDKYPNTCGDDQAWAAGWLWLADSENLNKDGDYLGTLNSVNASEYHHWQNVSVGAAYLKGVVSKNWDGIKNYLNGFIYDSGYKSFNAWGSARHNATAQLVALATANALKDSESDFDFAKQCAAWAQGQMDMLLGDNTWNNGESVCLVTGFASNSSKWAHHRAASGYDSDAEFEVETTYDDDGHVLIGGLVGGPAFGDHSEQSFQLAGYPELMAYHEYLDHVQDYCCNEVSLDFNAGLVGAAAGLYAFYKTGELSTKIEGIETMYLPDGYNGNSNGSTSSNSGSNSNSTSEQSNTTTTNVTSPAPEGYAAPNGYYLAAYTSQQVPSQEPKEQRSINLTGEALNIADTPIDRIVFQFNAPNGGSFNGGIFLNGEGDDNTIAKYSQDNQTVTHNFTTATTIHTLKVDSWWRQNEVTLEIFFLVKVTEPVIVGAPKALDLNGTAKLTVAGFTDNNVSWESSEPTVISVENGTVTAHNYGKATITATSGTESASVSIEVKLPISIDNTILRSGDTAETITTATLTSADGVTYSASPEGIVNISADGVVTPVAGASGTVKITASKNGATSDAVEVIVLKPLSVDMVTIGTNSRKDMDEVLAGRLLGLATWTVPKSDAYTVTPNASGTVITVTNSNNETILTLNTKTGIICTYGAEGMVTLTATDSADSASGNVIVNVKKTPYIADIPSQKTNLIGKIHLTANGATLDLINGAGMNTDRIQLSAASATASWSAVLQNLCQYDGMGNNYYYYIEEDVPDGGFSTVSSQYMVSGYTNNGTMLNGIDQDAASVSVTNARAGNVQRPLPSAGGEGRTNIYVVGVLLMLLSGAGFIGLKRRQRSQRKG